MSIELAFSTRSLPTPALNRCSQWLRQGYAQGTILGAVERVLKRGKAISTLDYFDAAIAEDHAKVPAASAGPQIVSIQEFIVEGTLERSAWNQYLRETTGRGSPVSDNRDDRGRIRRGWFRPTTFPPGYDEATGEKLPHQQRMQRDAKPSARIEIEALGQFLPLSAGVQGPPLGRPSQPAASRRNGPAVSPR